MVRKMIIILLVAIMLMTACKKNSKVVIADGGWDSIRLNNAIVVIIFKHVYGIDTEVMTASTPILMQGLQNGDIDIHMELWTDNIPTYKSDLESGRFIELGVNYDDNRQGIYIPYYVIHGDSSRGIAPIAPDLKTIEDLKKYIHVFNDEQDKNKGRLYGAIPGWEVDVIINNKYYHYGLDKDFNYFRPGSEAAINSIFVSSLEGGIPIAGYFWEPTWIAAKYNLIRLDDSPYTNEEDLKAGKTEIPSVRVTIGASNKFVKQYPEASMFLSNYHTGSRYMSEALLYMQETSAGYEETALWLISQYPELVYSWLDYDAALFILGYADGRR